MTGLAAGICCDIYNLFTVLRDNAISSGYYKSKKGLSNRLCCMSSKTKKRAQEDADKHHSVEGGVMNVVAPLPKLTTIYKQKIGQIMKFLLFATLKPILF